MREHDLRKRVVEEMHLRRWPRLSAPMEIVQILNILDEGDRARERDFVAQFSGNPACLTGASHVSGTLHSGIAYTWERHSEASTVTLFIDSGQSESAYHAVSKMEKLPGAAIRATRIKIVEDEENAQARLEDMAFVGDELISCHVGDGIRIWSDFRIGPEGYGRLLVAANGASDCDLTRTVQRFQELGNYRNLALMGLPVAQAQSRLLHEAEAKLGDLGQLLSHPEVRDDDLLSELCQLSLEIGALAGATNYRMSATAAYAQLVDERLAELAPRPIRGCQSLTDFTQRRFLPAVRTCASFTKRSRQIANLAAHLSSLLRTRIETRIENQNARLLASLEQNTSMTLRLQQLVEGLSVVAISYYGVSLLGHMLEGIEPFAPALHASAIVSVATPLILTGTWFCLHRLRKALLRQSGAGSNPEQLERKPR